MPRSRRQVARFDPSPEAVAPWNDTSLKTRVVVDLQARVRHGLSSAEAAAAAIAAAQAEAAAAQQRAALERRRATPSGRKRQRSATAPAAARGCSKWPPPISELRAGQHHQGAEGGASSVTDSTSVGCVTSGSESDSSSSGASEMIPSSRSAQRLAWRPPQAAGGGEVGGELAASAGSGTSDTDSEYCSDLTCQRVGGLSAASCANSDRGSSCSTPLCFDECSPTAAGDESGRASPIGESKTRKRDGERDEDEEQEQGSTKNGRNVVTVKLARSQTPSRWAARPPPFETCLKSVQPEDRLGGRGGGSGTCAGDDAAAAAAASMLGLCEGDVVDAKNWLSSGFIDVVMAKFARTYTNVHFMPIDFAVLCLNGWGAAEAMASAAAPTSTARRPSSPAGTCGGGSGDRGGGGASAAAFADESMVFRDILGRPIVYSEKRPVIFLTHVNNVHWNLLRVEHDPVPELQLFEPMGKPPRRQGGSRYTRLQPGGACRAGGRSAARGTGFRCIPKEVYRWLDAVWPLHPPECRGDGGSSDGAGGGGSKRKAPGPTPSLESWATRAYSAITRQQQTTGFDCGVASLLYAEKCGQGQMREDVDAWTTQGDMTEYRRALQRYVEEVLWSEGKESPSPPSADPPGAGASSAGGSAHAVCGAKPEVVVVDPPPSPLPRSSLPSPAADAVAVPAATASAPLSLT